MSNFHPLTIKEVIKETTDTVSLVFDVPSDLQNKFNFVSGQYVTLKTEIDGQNIRRAYSLCSSPKSGVVKVTVKTVEGGIFSVYANQKLKSGDTIEVGVPEGKFILTPENNKNYIGFVAGSGITPVLSMIKSVLESDTNATFTLIYGNKLPEKTIFYNEINALAEANSNQLSVHYIYSKANIEGSLSGRINKEHVRDFIQNKDTKFDNAFLCGPEEMITIASDTLADNGFSKESIFFELFTASTSTSEETVATTENNNGETKITVILDDEETTFTMSQTDNILAASLRNKLDAPYSCQGGVCSSCIAKVTEGKAVMTKNMILDEDEVAEGIIITCQAHPTTSNITIDFDDV